MPSKYQPQIFGWGGDLPKGKWCDCDAKNDDSLIYINDTHCVLSRLNTGKRLLLCFYWIFAFILLLVMTYIAFVMIDLSEQQWRGEEKLVMFLARIMIIIVFQLITPNVFMVLFSPKHIPIVFNRKTNKVYVNESEFFSLKTRLTPFYLFYPLRKRIQEFDWDDLHCSVIPNHNVNSMISLALMVCHPNTFDVKTHIVLHYCRSSSGIYSDNVRWGWVNNYMYDYADLNEDDTQWGWSYGQFIFPERSIGAPAFNWEDYTKKNKDYDVSLYNWPAWMIEAFDAQSLDELAEIKKKHGVEE